MCDVQGQREDSPEGDPDQHREQAGTKHGTAAEVARDEPKDEDDHAGDDHGPVSPEIGTFREAPSRPIAGSHLARKNGRPCTTKRRDTIPPSTSTGTGSAPFRAITMKPMPQMMKSRNARRR